MCNDKEKKNGKDDKIVNCFEEAKYSDKEYLEELENFLDILDNIEDKELRKKIIYKMHRIESIGCGISINVLKKLIEENLNKG